MKKIDFTVSVFISPAPNEYEELACVTLKQIRPKTRDRMMPIINELEPLEQVRQLNRLRLLTDEGINTQLDRLEIAVMCRNLSAN